LFTIEKQAIISGMVSSCFALLDVLFIKKKKKKRKGKVRLSFSHKWLMLSKKDWVFIYITARFE